MILEKQAYQTAYKLQTVGYGFTVEMMGATAAICSKIDIEDLAQIVAISAWVSQKESVSFYKVLSEELRKMGAFKNRKSLIVDFDLTSRLEDTQYKQLENLYAACGFKLFYSLLGFTQPFSTVQKWTHAVFASRGLNTACKKYIKTIKELTENGHTIRFSKTSSSVYIETERGTIRISNHEQGINKNELILNIQL